MSEEGGVDLYSCRGYDDVPGGGTSTTTMRWRQSLASRCPLGAAPRELGARGAAGRTGCRRPARRDWGSEKARVLCLAGRRRQLLSTVDEGLRGFSLVAEDVRLHDG
jgi:hypothetical protein